MRSFSHPSARRRALLMAAPLALALVLGACDGDDDDDLQAPPTTTPTTPATSTPTPTPSQANRNVSACLTQTIPGTVNAATNSPFTPASLVVPDTLKVNFSQPSGYPNGRFLTDPVIDVVLAVLLLDLRQHSPALFAGLPLNPPNDSTLVGAFPFFGTANGGQPAPGTGTTFNFRTDPVTAYTRVDRMGQPAVATALISSSQKNPYNDADPVDDATGVFVPTITAQLTALHNALADDLAGLNLTPCSTPG